MFTDDQILNAKRVLAFGKDMLTKALESEDFIEQQDPTNVEYATAELSRIDELTACIGTVELDLEQLSSLFRHINTIHSVLEQIEMLKSLGASVPDMEDNAFVKFSEEQVSFPDLLDLGNRVIELGTAMEEDSSSPTLTDSDGNVVSIDSTVKH